MAKPQTNHGLFLVAIVAVVAILAMLFLYIGTIATIRMTDESLLTGEAVKIARCDDYLDFCESGRHNSERFCTIYSDYCTDQCYPVAESCNGLDDDCDGQVDEGLTAICGTNVGTCTYGQRTCTAGAWSSCTGGITPVQEACNGEDDDCDNEIDEDGVCEVQPVTATSTFSFDQEASTVTDEEGSLAGTIMGSADWVTGMAHAALDLSGGYIDLGQDNDYATTDHVTLAARIKPDQASGYQGIIMHGGPNTDTFALYIRPDGPDIGFKTTGTTNDWQTTTATKLYDGEWHHVAAAYDGQEKTIYLDGEPLLTTPSTGTIASGTGYRLLIGAGRDEASPTLRYYGLIDDVLISTQAYDAAAIQALAATNTLPEEPSCTPAQETCNGLDDDCDDQVDEGFLCNQGYTCQGTQGCVANPEDPCPAGALCYYVDNQISGCTTYDPATRSCGEGVATAYSTIQEGADHLSPGGHLLIREGTYDESVTLTKSGTASAPITIAAYANEKPVIDAADTITGWTACASQADCKGNPNWQHLYKATPGFTVQQLFQGGERLVPSTYPEGDRHWEQFSSTAGETTFYDDSLNFPDNYFVGATAAIKHWPWHVDFRTITDSDTNGRVVIDSAITYPWDADDTYYFFNIVPEIDDPGEWAYDSSTGILYLWPKESLIGIQASKRDYCIDSNWDLAYNELSGLTCNHANYCGMRFKGANHVTLQDSSINFAYRLGVYLYSNSDGVSIIGNNITRSGAFGITDGWAYSKNLLIEDNYIYASGAEHYADVLYVDRGMGIQARGENIRILHNRIEKTGANGIFFRDDRRNNEIAYNYIKDTCLSLTDQGGIYTDGLSETGLKDRIHHNIFEDVHGYSGGFYDWGAMYKCKDTTEHNLCDGYVQGIYNDEQGNDYIFDHNTVINAPKGVFFHWAPESDLINNTFYANSDGQGHISGTSLTATRTLKDLNVKGNVFFSTAPAPYTFYLSINYDDLDYGVSDYNYFYNPYTTDHMRLGYPGYDARITLNTWQSMTGKDAHSKEIGPVYATDNQDNNGNRDSFIIYNREMETKTVSLGGQYCDLDGNTVTSTTLEPYTSQILLNCFCNHDDSCNNKETATTCPEDC